MDARVTKLLCLMLLSIVPMCGLQYSTSTQKIYNLNVNGDIFTVVLTEDKSMLEGTGKCSIAYDQLEIVCKVGLNTTLNHDKSTTNKINLYLKGSK